MDELRELAVRTALFEHLDDSLLASDDDTLGWNQTESFKFNGEVFSIRQPSAVASVTCGTQWRIVDHDSVHTIWKATPF